MPGGGLKLPASVEVAAVKRSPVKQSRECIHHVQSAKDGILTCKGLREGSGCGITMLQVSPCARGLGSSVVFVAEKAGE